MTRKTFLLAASCLLLAAPLFLATPSAQADHPHWDKVNGRIYQHHQASPRLVRAPYPGRYRDYALRYHYERNTIFHGGPYYHVYHGRYLGHLNRPYHLGYGPPRSEWKRGVRDF